MYFDKDYDLVYTRMMINALSNRSPIAVRFEKSPNTQGAAKGAITDSFIERIKEYAKEDAKQGIYMSEGFTKFRLARMKQCVSPDRSGPKADVMSAIQAALKEPHPMLQALEKMLDKLSGGCSAKLKISAIHQAAEVTAPNGEVIAFYSSNGGWTDIQTKEEHKFYSETASIYAQAFREARTEMKAPDQGQAPQQGNTTAVDVRA